MLLTTCTDFLGGIADLDDTKRWNLYAMWDVRFMWFKVEAGDLFFSCAGDAFAWIEWIFWFKWWMGESCVLSLKIVVAFISFSGWMVCGKKASSSVHLAGGLLLNLKFSGKHFFSSFFFLLLYKQIQHDSLIKESVQYKPKDDTRSETHLATGVRSCGLCHSTLSNVIPHHQRLQRGENRYPRPPTRNTRTTRVLPHWAASRKGLEGRATGVVAFSLQLDKGRGSKAARFDCSAWQTMDYAVRPLCGPLAQQRHEPIPPADGRFDKRTLDQRRAKGVGKGRPGKSLPRNSRLESHPEPIAQTATHLHDQADVQAHHRSQHQARKVVRRRNRETDVVDSQIRRKEHAASGFDDGL